MPNLQTSFWVAVAIVFYSFLGYGIVLCLLVKTRSFFAAKKNRFTYYCPDVTLVVPCYNECSILQEKISNCLQLDYPADKLKIAFITDGSTDGSVELLKSYPFIQNLHIARRGGKTAAENRAMNIVDSPIVIFSDVNTMLNVEAVLNIIRHFADEKVGCVSGAKRNLARGGDIANPEMESMFLRYEALQKKWDSELCSAVGATSELVAFRRRVYENMPEDTILGDFMQSMIIASKGYKVVHEPAAYAMEPALASVSAELEKTIRISAGGWQTVHRLASRISFIDQPVLFYQYYSHWVLKCAIAPFLLLFIYIANAFLLRDNIFYVGIFGLQFLFYSAAFAGYFFNARQMRVKAFSNSYYFCAMHYASVCGFIRFLRGKQSVVWEKKISVEQVRNDGFSKVA